MFASLVSTPVVVSLARADGVASSRASRASASVPTVASPPRGDADRVALTRRGILGAAALAAFASPAPAHARRANKFADLSSLSPPSSARRVHPQPHRADLRPRRRTIHRRGRVARPVPGVVRRGQGLLLPQVPGKILPHDHQLVAYLRTPSPPPSLRIRRLEPPFDVAKTKEWIGYAEGFTSGALAGDDARAAFARATWGNYVKSAPLNRFGLCAFGETGGTRALGVDCEGY